MINRNALTSPLLKLPRELRDQIFRLVVGNQFIHIKWTDRLGCDDKLHYVTCVATVSESETYKEFSSGYNNVPPKDSPGYYTSTCEKRHEECRLWEKRQHKMPDLLMLNASRQISEEANLLLWSTNTYSFEDPVSFEKFMSKLTFHQKNKFTNMHISTDWATYYYGFYYAWWERTLNTRVLLMLKGLKTVHLCFDQELDHPATWPYQTMREEKDRSSAELLSSRLLESFGSLQMLHLQHVTVVIADKIGDAEHLTNRWSNQNNREIAEKVRSKLLEPEEGKVLMKEDKIKQEMQEKGKEARKAESARR